MPRQRPPTKDADAIARRLKHFVQQRYGSWRAFEEQLAIPRTTRLAWSRRQSPAVPDTPLLLRFAREANLNLNWLLLGEPPDLRVEPARNPVEQFYAVLEAELRSSEDVGPVDFDFAWTQINTRTQS